MGSTTPVGRRPLPPLPPRASVAPGSAVAPRASVAHGSSVAPRPARPATGRSRPDPTGVRLAIGLGGLAAASALATAFLAPMTAGASATTTAVVSADAGAVQHVTQYVHLLPGQTPPANATVAQAPAATPRVVVVTTRQSGVKP